MNKTRMPVAKEGYPFVALAALTAVITAILGYAVMALSALALTFFIVYFFRDPERITPMAEDAIVAPADGKIILIEKIFDDKYVKEHVYKISIFMNIFNVHVNRVPYPGIVTGVHYSPGLFYSANTERAALENESCAVIMSTKTDDRLAMVQIAGLIARRIVCWTTKGDKLARGQRFGLIRFGSRVDLYLPLRAHLEVSIGQKVKAGETLLGYLD